MVDKIINCLKSEIPSKQQFVTVKWKKEVTKSLNFDPDSSPLAWSHYMKIYNLTILKNAVLAC